MRQHDDDTGVDPFADDEESEEGSDPADAFAALSDPLRVDILREMSAHRRETGDLVVGFADLRKRVGVRDSGRFRYHLNQLRDTFVEKDEGGYRLTPAGGKVVGAVIAGTYTDEVSLGPADLESTCPACDESALAVFEDGVCTVTCPADHPLFQWPVPPNAAADAALPAVVDLAELLAFQAIEQALAGVCPECYSPVETVVVTDVPSWPGELPSLPGFRARCDTCGGRVVGPVTFPLLVDPAVVAFCRRHGYTLREDHVWEFPFVADGPEVTVTEDPLRVECAVSFEGNLLRVTVDERGHVVGVEYPDGE